MFLHPWRGVFQQTAKLNDEVKHTGVSPPLGAYNGFVYCHYFIKLAMWVVILRLLSELPDLLFATIKYPVFLI